MPSRIDALYTAEALAARHTLIHRLHPMAKLLCTLIYIITVVSFDRYAFGALAPFIFYPVLVAALSETPWRFLLKRAAAALPFCICAGVWDLLFLRETAFTLGTVAVSTGVLAFFVLLFRAFLCVTAALLLLCVTPFADLTAQLRRLRVPLPLVMVFEMTVRYISVLYEEAATMQTAYALRRGARKNRRGVDIRHAGSFVGGLLLRCIDRAERVYAAMQCRGYGRCPKP